MCSWDQYASPGDAQRLHQPGFATARTTSEPAATLTPNNRPLTWLMSHYSPEYLPPKNKAGFGAGLRPADAAVSGVLV